MLIHLPPVSSRQWGQKRLAGRGRRALRSVPWNRSDTMAVYRFNGCHIAARSFGSTPVAAATAATSEGLRPLTASSTGLAANALLRATVAGSRSAMEILRRAA